MSSSPGTSSSSPPVPRVHRVQNDSEEPARVLMYSTVVQPAATVYPDSDKIAVWTGNSDDDLIARRSSAVDYFDGET
jgi:uncharacterized cupin superfamily protein